MKPTVLIFLKAPRAGAVKTRLAADVGAERALQIYRWLAERQLAAIPEDWLVEVHFTPQDARLEMEAWLGKAAGRSFWPQPDGGLGERLASASQGAIDRGAEAIFLVGGDCADLNGERLTRAAEELRSHDTVLGPAEDGGYYLLGVKQMEPRLFKDIAWSSATVADDTRRQLRAVDWTWAELPMLSDVDTVADWSRCRQRLGIEEP